MSSIWFYELRVRWNINNKKCGRKKFPAIQDLSQRPQALRLIDATLLRELSRGIRRLLRDNRTAV